MKNSKLAKGIAAGALGLTLLLGGGTFALWYQTQPVATSGNINSGNLGFTVGTQVWKNVTGGNTSIADITTFKMVPGDTVSLTAPVTLTASGDNLKATLKVDLSGLTGNAQLLAALKANTTYTIAATPGLANPTYNAGTGGYEIVAADNAKVASVIVSIHFPKAKDGDTPLADRSNWWGTGTASAQSQAVQLNSLTFDLAQH